MYEEAPSKIREIAGKGEEPQTQEQEWHNNYSSPLQSSLHVISILIRQTQWGQTPQS